MVIGSTRLRGTEVMQMPENKNEGSGGSRNIWVRYFGKTTTLRQDMLICFGITFACSMFGFDSYIDNKIMLPIRCIASFLMMMNWLWAAYSSGKHRRGGFVLFTGVYWLVPAAASFFIGAGNPDDTVSVIIGEIANILVFYPFSFFSRAFNINEWIFCALMVCIVTAMYIFSERKNPHLNSGEDE